VIRSVQSKMFVESYAVDSGWCMLAWHFRFQKILLAKKNLIWWICILLQNHSYTITSLQSKNITSFWINTLFRLH